MSHIYYNSYYWKRVKFSSVLVKIQKGIDIYIIAQASMKKVVEETHSFEAKVAWYFCRRLDYNPTWSYYKSKQMMNISFLTF